MIAHPPVRQRGIGSLFTPVRVTFALLLALACLTFVPLIFRNAWLPTYFALVLTTCLMVRHVREEPRTWLRRRAVRRGLVVLIAVDSGALLASSATSGLAFALFLVVLNVCLGGATQRMAGAPDTAVDERQEALRNRAHRIAYAIFAALVGGTMVVADVASEQTRTWLGSTFGGGGLYVFLELLFVLPAMVLAFIEPVLPHRDVLELAGRRVNHRATRVAMGLLALTILTPLVLSVAVAVLPARASTTIQAPTDGPVPGATSCREFYATQVVGAGIGADLPLHAEVCWNGTRAFETFGLNASDCLMMQYSAEVTTVTPLQCTRTTTASGTLAFTFRADVGPMLLPFLHRETTLRLVVDRNGHVEEFP